MAVARLAAEAADAKRLIVPRGLRKLTILSCRGGDESALGALRAFPLFAASPHASECACAWGGPILMH